MSHMKLQDIRGKSQTLLESDYTRLDIKVTVNGNHPQAGYVAWIRARWVSFYVSSIRKMPKGLCADDLTLLFMCDFFYFWS